MNILSPDDLNIVHASEIFCSREGIIDIMIIIHQYVISILKAQLLSLSRVVLCLSSHQPVEEVDINQTGV